MKAGRVTATIAALAIVGAAQFSTSAQSPQTTNPGGQAAPAKPIDRLAEKSVRVEFTPGEFVEHMTIVNLAETQLGKLAADRSSNVKVKAFADGMVKDHTVANRELAEIAAQMKVRPPATVDEKHRDLADRLSRLQGEAFDRDYVAAMVKGHEEVLTQLRTRVGTQQDNEGASGRPTPPPNATAERTLNQWAATMIPIVEKHLKEAKDIHASLSQVIH